MCLFQAALDTPRDGPFTATLSVHGLHFTVYALSTCEFLGIPATTRVRDASEDHESSHAHNPQGHGQAFLCKVRIRIAMKIWRSFLARIRATRQKSFIGRLWVFFGEGGGGKEILPPTCNVMLVRRHVGSFGKTEYSATIYDIRLPLV